MEEGEEIRTELVLSLNYKNTKENAFQWRNLYIKQFGVPTYPPPMPPNPATTNAEYPSRHDIPGLVCVNDDAGTAYNAEEDIAEPTSADASLYAGRSSSRLTRKSHYRSGAWRELGTTREVMENLELFSSHMFEFLLPKRRSRRQAMNTSIAGSGEVSSPLSLYADDDPTSAWRTISVKDGREGPYGGVRSGVSFAIWDQRPELREKMNPHNIPRELLALQHNAWMLLMDNRPLAWLERDINQKGSTMDKVRSKLLAIATSSHALSSSSPSSSSWRETSEEELVNSVIPPMSEEAAENRVFESFSPYFTVISSPSVLHQLQERFLFCNRLPRHGSLASGEKEGDAEGTGGVARMENMVGYPLFSQYASWRETYENRKVWNCAPFSFFLIYDTSFNYAHISALFVMLELIHHHGHTHSLKCLGQLGEPISLEEASQHFLQKKNVRDQLEKRRTLCPLIAMQKSLEDIILAFEQSSSRTTLTMMKQVCGFLTECVLEPEVSHRFLSQDAIFRQAEFTLPGLHVAKGYEASQTAWNGVNPSESASATANRNADAEKTKNGEKESGNEGSVTAGSKATGEEDGGGTVDEGKRKLLPSFRSSRKKNNHNNSSATLNESASYMSKSSASASVPFAAHLSLASVLPTPPTSTHNTSIMGAGSTLGNKQYTEKDLDVLFHLSYWFIDAATANSRIPIDPYLLPPTPAEKWRQDKSDGRDLLHTGSSLTTPTTGGGEADGFPAATKGGRPHAPRGAGVPASSSSSPSRPHGTPSAALAPPLPRSLSPYPALSSSSSSSALATAAARGWSGVGNGGGEGGKDARHPTPSPPPHSASLTGSVKHLVKEHLYLPGKIQAYSAVGSVVDALILYRMRHTALLQWMAKGDPSSPVSPSQSLPSPARKTSGAAGMGGGSPAVSTSFYGSPSLVSGSHLGSGGGGGGGGGKSKRTHPLPRSEAATHTTSPPPVRVASLPLSGGVRGGGGGRLPTEAEYRAMYLSPSTTLLGTPLILLTTYIRLHGGTWLKHIFGRLFNILRRESVVLYVNRLELEDPFFYPAAPSVTGVSEGGPTPTTTASRPFPIGEDSSSKSSLDSNDTSQKVSRTLTPVKTSTMVDATIASYGRGETVPLEGAVPRSRRGREPQAELQPAPADPLRSSSAAAPPLPHAASISLTPRGGEEVDATTGNHTTTTTNGEDAFADPPPLPAIGRRGSGAVPTSTRSSVFYSTGAEKHRSRHSSIAELGTFRKRMERLEDLIAQDIIFVMNEFFSSLYGKRSATRLSQGITTLVTQFCTSIHYHILSNIVAPSDVSHNPLVVTMVHRVVELLHALKSKQMTAKAFRPQVLSDFPITRLITTIEQLRLSKFILFDCWIIPSLNNVVSLGYLSENSSTHLRWNIDAFARYLKILVNGPFTEGDKRAFTSARGGGVTTLRHGSGSEISGSLGGGGGVGASSSSSGWVGGFSSHSPGALPPLSRGGAGAATSSPPLPTTPPDGSISSVAFHPPHRRTHTGGVTGGGGGGGGGSKGNPSMAADGGAGGGGGGGGGDASAASTPPFTLSIPSYITGIYDVSSGCLVRLFTDVDLTRTHSGTLSSLGNTMGAFVPHDDVAWWAAHRGSQATSSAHGESVTRLSEVSLFSADATAADRSARPTLKGSIAAGGGGGGGGGEGPGGASTTTTTSSIPSSHISPGSRRVSNARATRHSSAVNPNPPLMHHPSSVSGASGGNPPLHAAPSHPGWGAPPPAASAAFLPVPAALSKSLFAKNLYYRVMDSASWEDISSRLRGLNERLGLHDYEPDDVDELGLIIGGTSGFFSPLGPGTGEKGGVGWSYSNGGNPTSPSALSPDTAGREEYCAMRMLDAFCRRSSTENAQNVVVSEYDVHPAMAVTCTDKVYDVMAGTHPLIEQAMQDNVFPGKYSYSPYIACLSGVLLHPHVALQALDSIYKNSRRFYYSLMRPMSHPTFLNMVDALIQSGNDLPLVDTNSLAPLLATVKQPAASADAGGAVLRVCGREDEVERGVERDEEDNTSESGQSDDHPLHSLKDRRGGGESGASSSQYDSSAGRVSRHLTSSVGSAGGGGGGGGSRRRQRELLLSASHAEDDPQGRFMELDRRSLQDSSNESSGSESSSSSGRKEAKGSGAATAHMKLVENVRKLQIQQSFLLTGCPFTPLSTRLLLRRAGPFSPYKILLEGEAAITKDTGILPSTFDPWWRAMVFALCVKATNVIRECDNAQSSRFEDWCRGQLDTNRREGRLATNAFVLSKGIDTSAKTAGGQPTPNTQGLTKRMPVGPTTVRRRRRGVGGNRRKSNPGSSNTPAAGATAVAAAGVPGSTGGAAVGDGGGGGGVRKEGGDAGHRGRRPLRGKKKGRTPPVRKVSPAMQLGDEPEIQRLFKRAATGPLPPPSKKERFPFQR